MRVAPWPGKCLAQAATPPACSPRTNATACRATSSGSAPNERSPITGLSGSELHVDDRAEHHVDADRTRPRAPMPASHLLRGLDVVERAEGRVARATATRRRRRAG